MHTGFFKNRWVKISAAMVLLLTVAVISCICFQLASNRIYYGISIENVPLSNVGENEAYYEVVQRLNDMYDDVSIPLVYGSNIWILKPSDISYSFMIDDAINKALSIGKTGSIANRLREIFDLVVNPVNVVVKCEFDNNKLKHVLEEISKDIGRDEKNASVEFEEEGIRFISHITGRRMDIEKNLDVLKKRLEKRNFETVMLEVEETMPEILIEDINMIDGELSSFTTRFNPGQVNRSHNIATACKKLKRTVVMPGNIFSMDLALGPRTLENGYLNAPVIIKNELTDDIGGGICQVTTTLYNSVLLAGLEVIERTHHSWPLGYVDAGRDATIAEGSIDFKFKNNTGNAICINANAENGSLSIAVWGRTDDKKQNYRLRSIILEVYNPPAERIVIDNSLPDGVKKIDVKARKGYKVAVYREKVDNSGEILDSEIVSIDNYRPVGQVTRVNGSYATESEISSMKYKVSE